MKAHEIAGTAAELMSGDRARTHGDKTQNHRNIADLWNAWLGSQLRQPLTAHDAAIMMALLKIARMKLGALNIDDYIDGGAYVSIAGEIAQGDAERLDKAG